MRTIAGHTVKYLSQTNPIIIVLIKDTSYLVILPLSIHQQWFQQTFKALCGHSLSKDQDAFNTAPRKRHIRAHHWDVKARFLILRSL